MKKILLATTLLAASTGFAAAEVATSGSARMGLIFDGDDAFFTSRIRVIFKMSGTTDGGLEFGAEVRADQASEANSGGTSMDAGKVFISGAFGKLSMGDLDTASNELVGNVSGVGLTGLGDLNELGYVGQTDTSIRYEYTAGAFTAALSAGQIGNEEFSVAVKYSTDAYSVALGYEDGGVFGDEQLALGGSATFGAATVKAVVVDYSGYDDLEYALSVDYDMGAVAITAFYAHQDDFLGEEYFGLGAAYDLGGGAKVVGGIVSVDGDETIADVGISMSF